MILGIDISHHQNAINFQKVKNDGIQFVIAKISQAQWKDPMFYTYYADCHNLIDLGGYIYNKVYSVEEAEKEANFAVSVLSKKPLRCGVWLDMEDASMRKLSKKTLHDIINCESYILQSAGYDVGIYCNRDWYNNVLDGIKLSKDYPFWIARYPTRDVGEIVESLSPRSYADIWQYSSKGKVDGIPGNVDRDILYTSFSTMFSQKKVNTINGTTRRTLKIGDRGEDVKYLQERLVSKGDYITVDSIYGQNTFNAVISFQAKNGLKKDGIVGIKTWTALS